MHTMTEFELIARYFQTPNHHRRSDVILGIGDDAALLQPPSNQLLAVTTDTLIEGVHFLPDTAAETLGHKALAVSLSDLAAMGAEPAWALLSLTLPSVQEDWLAAFCAGFFGLSKLHHVQLVGGNTTRGPLSISTHLTGFVPPGKSLQRNGATPGDLIYVTGTLGDAAAVLAYQEGKTWLSPAAYQELKPRLEAPTARVSAGLILRDIATAAIDISDGLAADLGHILEQSKVGAIVQIEDIPLSPSLKNLPPHIARTLAISGGDDYELCFTAPPRHVPMLEKQFAQQHIPCQKIGRICEGKEIEWMSEGIEDFTLASRQGYQHF
jgi:thiamine-monophosphate kinase